jgi:peptide deformylase
VIQQIVRMGNPSLREESQEVSELELKTDNFTQLLLDLKESMDHYGGIGIAAPQIGVQKKVAIIELSPTNRYGEEISLPLTTFINPIMEILNPEVKGYWEGCLSVPGLRGFVERPQHLRVSFLNELGERKVIEARGFLATVIQHELDHLFGVLYVDRIKDLSLLSFQEEYDQFHKS